MAMTMTVAKYGYGASEMVRVLDTKPIRLRTPAGPVSVRQVEGYASKDRYWIADSRLYVIRPPWAPKWWETWEYLSDRGPK